jgi:hypothetical protein
MTMSHYIHLRMRNVSDKNWRENKNTHFMASIAKIIHILPTGIHACTQTHTHTHRYVILMFSMATMITEHASMLCHMYTACLV